MNRLGFLFSLRRQGGARVFLYEEVRPRVFLLEEVRPQLLLA